jgi:hypothetical protein
MAACRHAAGILSLYLCTGDECVALSQDVDCAAINCSRYRLDDQYPDTRTVKASLVYLDLTGMPIGSMQLTGRSDKKCNTYYGTVELVI